MYAPAANFRGGPPNTAHLELYKNWGRGRWGVISAGNIQVDKSRLTVGRDMFVPDVFNETTLQPFKDLAEAIHRGPDAGSRSLPPNIVHNATLTFRKASLELDLEAFALGPSAHSEFCSSWSEGGWILSTAIPPSLIQHAQGDDYP